MSKTVSSKLLVRRDTSSNWETNNPVLAQGEIGYDITVGKHKIGDGTSTWSALSFFSLDSQKDVFIVNDIGTNNSATLVLDKTFTQIKSNMDNGKVIILKRLNWTPSRLYFGTFASDSVIRFSRIQPMSIDAEKVAVRYLSISHFELKNDNTVSYGSKTYPLNVTLPSSIGTPGQVPVVNSSSSTTLTWADLPQAISPQNNNNVIEMLQSRGLVANTTLEINQLGQVHAGTAVTSNYQEEV